PPVARCGSSIGSVHGVGDADLPSFLHALEIAGMFVRDWTKVCGIWRGGARGSTDGPRCGPAHHGRYFSAAPTKRSSRRHSRRSEAESGKPGAARTGLAAPGFLLSQE